MSSLNCPATGVQLSEPASPPDDDTAAADNQLPDQTETPPLGAVPGVRFTACPFDESTIERDIQCGVLDTYENYENTGPDARIIQVAFGILPATEQPAAPDPVVVFIGGPGASALAEFALNPDNIELFTDNRDLILVDQRGAGFSDPFLTCDNQLFRDAADVNVDEVRSCIAEFEQQGGELSQYRSAVIAQDFRSLRGALNIQQWNVYGESYGPIPGLLYADLDPTGVRSVIFDSSTDNQVDLAVADVSAPLDLLTELGILCEAEAECSARIPDLQSVFLDTFASLMNDPWLVDVPLVGEVELDGFEMASLLVDGDGIYGPAVLDTFATRNSEVMIPLLQRFRAERQTPSRQIDPDLRRRLEADLMHTTVQCAAIDAENFETAVIPTRSVWPAEFVELVRGTVGYPAICNLDVIAIEQDLKQREPVSLDVPALVLGGALDPITSMTQVLKLGESFVSPTVGIVPKGGHGVGLPPGFNSCVNTMVTTFLNNPENPVDTSCLTNDVEPFVFGEAFVEGYQFN